MVGELTCDRSDMPWKKPGRVTVMEGAGPEPPPPSPAAPPSREPRSWARFPSGLPSAGCPTEAVLVVCVDVCPEVLAERGVEDTVEESDKDEVEKEGWGLVEDVVTGSPRGREKTKTK